MHGINLSSSGTEREGERLWGCRSLCTVKWPFFKTTTRRLRVRRTVTGFKHTFYSDLCSNDSTNFSRKDIIPALWFISSGSHCFSSCSYVLIFPSLSCAAAVPLQFPCPRGMPRLPAGRTRQPLGIRGWQPKDRLGFSTQTMSVWTASAAGGRHWTAKALSWAVMASFSEKLQLLHTFSHAVYICWGLRFAWM